MKEIVFVDVDNTLLRGQSQLLFLRYLRAQKIITLGYYLSLVVWFLFYKIGLVSDPRPAMRYAFSFLRGMKVEDVHEIIHRFTDEILAPRIYRKCGEEIKMHQESGREIVLLSNAMEPIVREIGERIHVPVVCATRLATSVDANGIARFTGEMLGGIVYGDAKVEFVRSFLRERGNTGAELWAYGDHASDIPLLASVAHPVVVNPDRTLRKEASFRGWPIRHYQ